MHSIHARQAYRFTLLAGIAMYGLVAPAHAQIADQAEAAPAPQNDVADIVVTGTSIRGVAPVGAPVTSLDQESIQLQPGSTTTELLRNVPSIANLGASDQYFGAANNSNANITGGNGINLRGLGTEATLTLVNGHRVPPAGTQGQFFDPSIIPTFAIGKMEVMADGGSAIYGSDAVGGVVNILLRKNFNGVEISARQGFNGDVHSYQVGGIAGRRWDSGSIMIAYEHSERTPLAASARSLYTDDLRPYGGTDQRSFNSNPGNILVGATRYGIPSGQNGVGLTAAQIRATPANRQSAYEGVDAIPGQKRDSVIGMIEQELTSNLKVWGQGFYAHRVLDRIVGASSANLTVPRANPFFVHPTNPAAASVTVNYSFIDDYGVRDTNAYQTSWQGSAGFDLDIANNWKLSGYGSYGRNSEERALQDINSAQLTAALRDTNPLTAFNPFGDGSFTNPATLAKIRAYSAIGAVYTLKDFGATLDGDLFTLPGGAVKLALGAEYQDHSLRSYFRNTTAGADNSIVVYTPSRTSRTVKSGYAELFVPVVGRDNAMAGMEELSLSAALRHDDYSDFGGTTNPKFAVRYKPFDGLSFRGTFGKSFRAPTLSDIDPKTLTISLQDFTDPASASGVTRTLWVRGGSDTLGPEKATIWSLGFDYQPAFASGLNLSVTYFNVDYRNRIETPGNNALALTPAIQAQLGSLVTRNPSAALVQSFLNNPLFTGVKEDPANILAFVDGRKVNIGRLKTQGVEGSFTYVGDVSFGQVSAGVSGTYNLNFKRSTIPNVAPIDVLDTINNPLEFRARGNVGLNSGGFDGNVFVNYSAGYLNNSVTPVQHVKSYTTVDLSLRQKIADNVGFGLKNVTFSADVQNLFNRAPPPVLNGTLAFDPQVASILGRYFTVGVRASW